MQVVQQSNSLLLRKAVYSLPIGLECLALSNVNAQAVRWRKKRWDPPAKTKAFVFPQHVKWPLGELDEITRIDNRYKTQYKSVRSFLVQRYERMSDTSAAAMREAEEEEREHAALMEYNRKENERLEALRKTRVQRELDERLEEVMLIKLRNQEKDSKLRQEALRVLKETEEFASTFIPKEDFLTALSDAYDNPKDYNFALDKQGNIYPGRGTKPWQIPSQNLKKLPAAIKS